MALCRSSWPSTDGGWNHKTPQRSESAKKPKIKLNTSTSKKANGSTAQAKDASGKAKVKKSGEKKEAPKENLTPEERLERREVRIKRLFFSEEEAIITNSLIERSQVSAIQTPAWSP
jgi:hypothetical protein